jgi:glycosyltransferase involved in cell wall biosynthesis
MAREVVFSGDIFRMQPIGGITQVFLELMRRLHRPWRVIAGLHQSQVLGEFADRVQPALRVPRFPTSPRIYGGFNRLVDGRLSGLKGAILHPTYYRDPARLPRSVPVVVTVYDMTHELFPDLFRRKPWSSRDPATFKAALCRRAYLVVCISESTRAAVLDYLSVPERKTRVVKLGSRKWVAQADPVPGVRTPYFLWVGERHTYKNFSQTVEAWATHRETDGSKMLCIGGGSWRRSEKALFLHLGISDRVRQVQASEAQLRWAYENTVGLLYTSLCEGFGLPIIEAMSLGCEVVTSNVSSMPEVTGGLAHLADPGDLDSIQQALTECIEQERTEQRVAALTDHAATFSWQKTAAAMESVYQELE